MVNYFEYRLHKIEEMLHYIEQEEQHNLDAKTILLNEREGILKHLEGELK